MQVRPFVHSVRSVISAIVARLADAPRLAPAAWVLAAVMFLGMASLAVDIDSQIWLAVSILAVLLFGRSRKLAGGWRTFFLFLAAYLTLRYLAWRTFNTLTYHDPASFLAAILLYVAELYGIAVYLLGIFVNINPLRREPVPLPAEPEKLPSVDILIPSYNEPTEMLEVTLLAALQIRYPRMKLRVCLLDDGGTVQKRNDPAPAKSAEAWGRHEELRTLCERLGAHYITRERNLHAKAGNINSALKVTNGDLILVLDADHVPTVDILERTVGLFIQDPKLFLVQTPHFFINPDPVEKNLEVFGQMPSENEMFYSVIQPGLDSWNASFFCGSAAVLRRKYLEEVGGIAGDTITEDAETALGLHARGYNSAYIGRPMISGLQPETYTGFVVQRVRWAQGMVQIFLLKNPLLLKGLKFWQRLGYLSSSFFWFFAYARVIFLLAPAAYLILGLQIYDANLKQFTGYALPHVAAAMIVSNFLFGKVRWAFISELYELLQSLFSLPGIFRVIVSPRSPSFMVTPKGEHLEEDFISKLSGPFYAIYLLTLVALAAGVYRYVNFPAARDVTVITMGWELLNLIILNAALGALFERRQRRAKPRMPADIDALVFFPGNVALKCRINDLSVQGALLLTDQAGFEPVKNLVDAEFLAYNPALGKYLRPRIRVRNWRKLPGDRVAVGIEFVHMSQQERAVAVSFAHGDSDRWLRFQEQRSIRLGILQGFLILLRLGTVHAALHFLAILKSALGFILGVGQGGALGLRGLVSALATRVKLWLIS